MVRRICLFAGPGSGKSTTALELVSKLKKDGFDVELITEYIKTWAYQKKAPVSYDQFYVFAKQLYAEDVALRSVKLVVSDSPLFLNLAYSSFYGFSLSTSMVTIAKKFEDDFPAMNIFIDRTVRYQQHGRYQNYQEALNFDQHLTQFLAKYDVSCFHATVENVNNLYSQILERCHDCKNS